MGCKGNCNNNNNGFGQIINCILLFLFVIFVIAIIIYVYNHYVASQVATAALVQGSMYQQQMAYAARPPRQWPSSSQPPSINNNPCTFHPHRLLTWCSKHLRHQCTLRLRLLLHSRCTNNSHNNSISRQRRRHSPFRSPCVVNG